MATHTELLETFEQKIDYIFTDKSLLSSAFTHRSYLNEQSNKSTEHNERLEFLGDAVLELAVTKYLYNSYPQEPEGVLTAYRAALVNTESLSEAARLLEMDSYLVMSKGERMDTVKGRMHILANTFEAFVGALYLDQGFDQAEDFIAKQLFHKIDNIISHKLFKDAKSYFQEQAQEQEKVTPHYELLAHEGPDHDKEFVMGVYMGETLVAEGRGASKQKAETNAARAGLEEKGWV